MKTQRLWTSGLLALTILLAPIALLPSAGGLALAGGPIAEAAVGRATDTIENARPERGETAFGRLVADAIRSATNADIALVNAGSLRRGNLAAGPIEQADLDALLSFGDDEVVTLNITGAQLKAALERAVQAYPTNSSAFLHGAGFIGEFNAQAPINRRVTMVRINGREVSDDDNLSVAMPVSLAEGTAGFFTIWDARGATRSGKSLREALVNFIRANGDISPDNNTRFKPQP